MKPSHKTSTSNSLNVQNVETEEAPFAAIIAAVNGDPAPDEFSARAPHIALPTNYHALWVYR